VAGDPAGDAGDTAGGASNTPTRPSSRHEAIADLTPGRNLDPAAAGGGPVIARAISLWVETPALPCHCFAATLLAMTVVFATFPVRVEML
jgi:hypothetical protein